jgi:hypothetical protein
MWWEMRRVTYVSGIERENDEMATILKDIKRWQF